MTPARNLGPPGLNWALWGCNGGVSAVWDWIKRPWAVVTGCALLTGLAVGTVDDVSNAPIGALWAGAFLQAEERVACLDGHFTATPRPDDAIYLVVVTALRGDDDYRHLDQIARTLTRLYGEEAASLIQVESVACPPLLATGGNAAQELRQAQDGAQDVLRRAGADVVIWGDVLQAGRQIELRFL